MHYAQNAPTIYMATKIANINLKKGDVLIVIGMDRFLNTLNLLKIRSFKNVQIK
jgi:hypothetical protein